MISISLGDWERENLGTCGSSTTGTEGSADVRLKRWLRSLLIRRSKIFNVQRSTFGKFSLSSELQGSDKF